MGILDDASSPTALRAALDTAARSQGRSGPDGVTVAAFAHNATQGIERLREALLASCWRCERRASA